MNRQERKQFTQAKRQTQREEKRHERQNLRLWNKMLRKLRQKGALIDDIPTELFSSLPAFAQ